MPKKNSEVYQLALRMAGSGKFKSWKGIRDVLVEKGYRRAPDLLDGDKVRYSLRRQPRRRKDLQADLSCVDIPGNPNYLLPWVAAHSAV